MITTVVFDLDDTVYDEVDYCRSGFAAVAQHLATLSDAHSRDDIFAALWHQFTGGNRTRTFNVALNTLGLPCEQNLIRRLVDIYRTHVPRIHLSSETQSTLDQLRTIYTLAMLTDGFLPAQRLKVQALGIAHYFRAIIYTEELGRDCWKPSPRGFERLIDMLNIPPQQMAYVADNEMKDFIAPNAMGMLSIQVLRPTRLHIGTSPLPNAAAKQKIRRISDLPPILERA